MAKRNAVWLSVLLISSAWSQPLPQTCDCSYQQPIPEEPEEIQTENRRMLNDFNVDDAEVINVGPCNPSETPVNYQYGQSPSASLIVKPGALRFPPCAPIIVRPGQISLPVPAPIWVKPPPVQPPTPAPIIVRPPPIQPPTPSPISVRPPSIQPPVQQPYYVRVPAVTPPTPEPIRVQPPPVQVPKPGYLVIQPAAFRIPVPPTIAFQPNAPTSSSVTCTGSARILLYRPGLSRPIVLNNPGNQRFNQDIPDNPEVEYEPSNSLDFPQNPCPPEPCS